MQYWRDYNIVIFFIILFRWKCILLFLLLPRIGIGGKGLTVGTPIVLDRSSFPLPMFLFGTSESTGGGAGLKLGGPGDTGETDVSSPVAFSCTVTAFKDKGGGGGLNLGGPGELGQSGAILKSSFSARLELACSANGGGIALKTGVSGDGKTSLFWASLSSVSEVRFPVINGDVPSLSLLIFCLSSSIVSFCCLLGVLPDFRKVGFFGTGGL